MRILAFITALTFAAPAFAQSVPPLPTWKMIPRTAASVPLGTVVIGDAPSLKNVPRDNAVDLAKNGYVEEEYFISGTANAYTADQPTIDFLKPFGFGIGNAVAKADVPYTTRILVRRPIDVGVFSGTVQMEAIRDITESATTWQRTWPYIVKNGDVWVGVTVSKGNIATLHKKADAARYASLDLADETLRWDIFAQVAWMFRSPQGLLEQIGFLDIAMTKPGVFRFYASGWSLTGCMQAEYLNRGRHEKWRRPDGKPLIDGYLVGICPFTGQVHVPKDAAVIQMMSESEYQGDAGLVKAVAASRQADSNTAGERRFRWYDVAGSAHADYSDALQYNISLTQAGLAAEGAINCAQPITRLPGLNDVARGILNRLDDWVRAGRYPPAGKLFELNADSTIKRDADGNALGGVRPHWTSVPAATFVPATPAAPGAKPDPITKTVDGFCALLGHEKPFAKDKLAKLYKDHTDYVDKVTDAVVQLVNTKYMLAADADAEIAIAKKAAVP